MARMIRKKKRRFTIAVLILAVFLIGCIWQFVMEQIDQDRYPAPGSHVMTEAYKMHYVSQGDGQTAIVFISGSGTPCAYTDFYYLQESLSVVGQTISFDHAGSGWSSKTNEPRTLENLEAEMTVLLDTVAPEKPVILVCHSLGSLEAIYYAQTHPEKVRGIVFLDSGDPEFYRADSEMTAKLMNRGIALLRAMGLSRLLCDLGIPMPFYGESNRMKCLPAEIGAVDRAMLCRNAGSRETLKTIDEMNENAETVVKGPHLGKIPILVLSSDSGEAWSVVQNTLANWSDDGRRITLENSEYYLHWSNRYEVEEEILLFIDEVMSQKMESVG